MKNFLFVTIIASTLLFTGCGKEGSCSNCVSSETEEPSCSSCPTSLEDDDMLEGNMDDEMAPETDSVGIEEEAQK